MASAPPLIVVISMRSARSGLRLDETGDLSTPRRADFIVFPGQRRLLTVAPRASQAGPRFPT